MKALLCIIVIGVISNFSAQTWTVRNILKIAEMKYTSKDYEGTIAECTKGIAEDSSMYEFFMYRGISLVKTNQPTKALLDFKKTFRLRPYCSRANFHRAEAYYMLKRYNEALADINIAIEHKYDLTGCYLLRYKIHGDLNQKLAALNDLNQAINQSPELASIYLYRTELKLELNDLVGANADLDIAIKLDSNQIQSHFLRGLLKDKEKDFQSAINYYTSAIHLSPNFADAYLNRGIMKMMLKEYEDAVLDFDKYNSLQANKIAIHHLKARALYELNHLDTAIACYNIAIQKDPKNYQYLIERASTYYKKTISISNPDDEQVGKQIPAVEKYSNLALNDLALAKSLKPDSSHAYYLSAMLFTRKFEIKEAAFKENYDNSSDHEEEFIYQMIELLNSSILEINTAIAKDSTKGNYYELKGNIYLYLSKLHGFLLDATNDEKKIKNAQSQQAICEKEANRNLTKATLK